MVERTYEMMVTREWRKKKGDYAFAPDSGPSIKKRKKKTNLINNAKPVYCFNATTGERLDFPSCSACDLFYEVSTGSTRRRIRTQRVFNDGFQAFDNIA